MKGRVIENCGSVRALKGGRDDIGHEPLDRRRRVLEAVKTRDNLADPARTAGRIMSKKMMRITRVATPDTAGRRYREVRETSRMLRNYILYARKFVR
jgi:hypothetical protein